MIPRTRPPHRPFLHIIPAYIARADQMNEMQYMSTRKVPKSGVGPSPCNIKIKLIHIGLPAINETAHKIVRASFL